MLETLFKSLWFIIPSYVANIFPTLGARLKIPLNYPINSGLLGSHKTYQGFYSAWFGAFLILLLQKYLYRYEFFSNISLLDYSEINLFYYSIAFGIGTALGDSVKSFFKRRLGKKPGSSWPPFDQLDFVFGTLFFLLPLYIPPTRILLTILLITPILHLVANIVAYKLKLKKVWW